MKYYKSRSLAVSLILFLAITTSSTNGSAIRKRDDSKMSSDLDAAVSHFLEVTNDSSLTKAVKIPNDNINNDGANNTVIGLSISKNANKETSNFNITDKSIAIQEKPPENIKLQGSETFGNDVIETRLPMDHLMDNTSKIPFTTIILNKLQNYDSYKTSPQIYTFRNPISKTKDNSNNIITSSISTEYTKQKIDRSTTTQMFVSQHFINPIESGYNNEDTFRKNQVSTESLKDEEKFYETHEISTEIGENFIANLDSFKESVSESALNTYDTSSTISPLTTVSSTSNITSLVLSTESNYTIEPILISDQTSYEMNFSDDLSSFTTTEVPFKNLEYHTITTELTQTINGDIITDGQMIENKTATKDVDYLTTVYDSDMISAETVQIPVEKILGSTPTSSTLPMNLQKDLENGLENSLREFNLTITTVTNKKSSYDNSSTTQAMTNKGESLTMKLDTISSKRAGYIDNSETTSTKVQEATTQKYMNTLVKNHTENLGTMYETEVSDSDIGEDVGNKNMVVKESQSQMTEDAIKEELLIERTIRENELAKSRQRVTPIGNGPNSDILNTTELATINTLSVKPISSDKRKSTTLYVPSSNYKPMKKLDVQPSKPFIRDPDDNSWRNESISSLGIVFKPKNASKSFTEVIKNKTTESSTAVGKFDKNDVPELRLRLEKIAENRKSKKKRIDKFGDTVYSDYEESSENNNIFKEDITSPMVPFQKLNRSTTTPLPPKSSIEPDQIVNTIKKEKNNIFKSGVITPIGKQGTLNNLPDYYEATDDYDDYLALPEIDLKKFTISFKNENTVTTPAPKTYPTSPFDWGYTTSPETTYHADRQPTIQYFPPTKKVTVPAAQNDNQKANENNYISYKNKANLNVLNKSLKMTHDFSFSTVPSVTKHFQESTKQAAIPYYIMFHKNNNGNINSYLTSQPSITEPPRNLKLKDTDFNRATYLIKHYKDFINEAAKDIEDEKGSEFLPLTNAAIKEDPMTEIDKFNEQKELKPIGDYDYDSEFRKDIVNRFLDNFNENSDRFRVDFPVIYNNSVVHTKVNENGKVVASSSAFMKRLYETKETKSNKCDVNCERMTVDLSPAYELHYYVPDQEETEVMQPRPNTGYRFS